MPATRPAGGGGLLGNAATYLGMTVADLQAALRGGKSLAQITSGVSGKTVDGLVAAMLAPLKQRLDDAVTAGKLTQSQETTIVTNLTSRLTDLVNGKAAAGPAKLSGSTFPKTF